MVAEAGVLVPACPPLRTFGGALGGLRDEVALGAQRCRGGVGRGAPAVALGEPVGQVGEVRLDGLPQVGVQRGVGPHCEREVREGRRREPQLEHRLEARGVEPRRQRLEGAGRPRPCARPVHREGQPRCEREDGQTVGPVGIGTTEVVAARSVREVRHRLGVLHPAGGLLGVGRREAAHGGQAGRDAQVARDPGVVELPGERGRDELVTRLVDPAGRAERVAVPLQPHSQAVRDPRSVGAVRDPPSQPPPGVRVQADLVARVAETVELERVPVDERDRRAVHLGDLWVDADAPREARRFARRLGQAIAQLGGDLREVLEPGEGFRRAATQRPGIRLDVEAERDGDDRLGVHRIPCSHAVWPGSTPGGCRTRTAVTGAISA